jgi:hypothetical protein
VIALRAGLWTWTAMHPDFGAEVRSYAWDTGARLVLFDPIAPLPDGLPAKPRVVCLTSVWHKRATPELGYRVVPPREVAEPLPSTYDEERALWLEPLRALVVGDALGGLADPTWLPAGTTQADVRAKLRPWLERPIELVLPTHGDPFDRAELERLLAP